MQDHYELRLIEVSNKKIVRSMGIVNFSDALIEATNMWVASGHGYYVDIKFFLDDTDVGIVARIGRLGFPDNK